MKPQASSQPQSNASPGSLLTPGKWESSGGSTLKTHSHYHVTIICCTPAVERELPTQGTFVEQSGRHLNKHGQEGRAYGTRREQLG